MSEHDPALNSIIQIDRHIHSPARLLILAILRSVESVDFTFLLKQTGLTRGNLSSHLTRLEKAKYVTITKEFIDKVPRTLIRLSEPGQAARAAYRQNMQQVLDDLI